MTASPDRAGLLREARDKIAAFRTYPFREAPYGDKPYPMVLRSAVLEVLDAALAAPAPAGLRRSDLELIDSEASVAHDYIWQTDDPSLGSLTKDQASAAIWTIHNLVRAALAATGDSEGPLDETQITMEQARHSWQGHTLAEHIDAALIDFPARLSPKEAGE